MSTPSDSQEVLSSTFKGRTEDTWIYAVHAGALIVTHNNSRILCFFNPKTPEGFWGLGVPSVMLNTNEESFDPLENMSSSSSNLCISAPSKYACGEDQGEGDSDPKQILCPHGRGELLLSPELGPA